LNVLTGENPKYPGTATPGPPYQALILAPSAYADSLEALKNHWIEFRHIPTYLARIGSEAPDHAQAIRSYIQSFPEVSFVLLASDVDNPGGVASVPTWEVEDPIIGNFATDAPYGDRDGDGLADIAIGRWPVHDSREAAICARKSIEYDLQAPNQPYRLQWRGFTYDLPGGAVSRTMTREIGDAFLALTPSPAFGVQYVASEIPCCYEERKTTLINAVNQGAHLLWSIGTLADQHSVCQFIGNAEIIYQCGSPPGSRSYWPFDFDLARFSENRAYGFWFPLSCYVGGFDMPDLYDCQYDTWVRPIVEEFLVAPGKGPVACFAPSRISYQDENDRIGLEVLSRLTYETTQSVAQACMAAVKALAVAKPLSRTRAASYSFLGDPTIVMAWGDTPTSVLDSQLGSVSEFTVAPNPTNASLAFRFAIARTTEVSCAVYDVAGRRVNLV
jgi:hypothetical protein